LILEWSEEANAARFAQLDYIAQDKPAAAIDMDERIERQTERLLDHPNLGRKGRVKGTRELVITGSPFIAAYRVLGERIEIFRFLHGAQQWPAKKP
jgi:toxin ParE1/3/4